jgi:hypothetical protein
VGVAIKSVAKNSSESSLKTERRENVFLFFQTDFLFTEKNVSRLGLLSRGCPFTADFFQTNRTDSKLRRKPTVADLQSRNQSPRVIPTVAAHFLP